MARAEAAQKSADYYTIKEGTFRLKSTKDDPEAKARPYTNPKTKESGTAYERVFKALYGVIEDVSFRETSLPDGTVLRSINIDLGEDDNGTSVMVSTPQDSRFASDFLKKLPNIDLTKEVRLMPYDFEPKEGPRQVGLAVNHADPEGNFTIKVMDFFTKMEEKNGEKTYTNLHGFPEATDEDKSDWPFYFKKVNKFLIKYATEKILPRFAKNDTRSATEVFDQHNAKGDEAHNKAMDAAFDAIDPDSIPF